MSKRAIWFTSIGIVAAVIVAAAVLCMFLPQAVALAEPPEPTPVYILWGYGTLTYPEGSPSPTFAATGRAIALTAVVIDATEGYENPTPVEGLSVTITYTFEGFDTLVPPIACTGYTAHAALQSEVLDVSLYTIAAAETMDFSVEKRALTVDWGNTVFTYDGEQHYPAPTLQAVRQDYEADITIDLPDVLHGDAATDAGAYTATLALSQSDKNYYYISQSGDKVSEVQTAFTIDPRPITVRIADTAVFYGEDLPLPQAALTAGTLVAGALESDVYALSSPPAQDIAAGNYAAAGTYPIEGTALNSNYSVAFRSADGTQTYGTYTINPRPITVAAVAKTIIYGEAVPEWQATPTYGNDVVGYDATRPAVLEGHVVYALSCLSEGAPVTARTPVGTYAIEVQSLSNPNYSLTAVPATLTVQPRPVTVAAVAGNSVYGDAPVIPAPVLRYGNASVGFDDAKPAVLPDDDVYVLSCMQAGAAINAATDVGAYAIEVQVLSTPAAANYSVTPLASTFTVAPRPLKVHIDDSVSVYGDSLSPLTAEQGSVTGGVEGLYTLGSTAYLLAQNGVTPAGAYRIDGTPLTANYTFTFDIGTYSVLSRVVTLSWDSMRYTYDGLPHLPTPTLGNLVQGDDVSVTYQGAQINAGVYAAIATAIDNPNYALPQSAVSPFIIEKAPAVIDVSAVRTAFRYTGETFAVDGAVGTGEITYLNNEFSAIGTYTVTVVSAESDNYAAGQVSLQVQVLEAAPTVDAATGGKVYNKMLEAGAPQDVTALFAEAAATGGDAASVVLRQGDTTLVFDTAAIAAIGTEPAAIYIEVRPIAVVADAEAPDALFVDDEAIADWLKSEGLPADTRLVIDIALSVADWQGGSATVTTAFDLAVPRGREAKLYYVDADGNVYDKEATFADGTLTFTAEHFSRYIVVFESKLSHTAIVWLVIGGLAFAGLIFVLVYMLLIRPAVVRAKHNATFYDTPVEPADAQ